MSYRSERYNTDRSAKEKKWTPPDKSARQPFKALYQPSLNPEADAWHIIFFIENHLDYFSYPEMVASPEQIRFMVFLRPGEPYYPCSDRTFAAIINRKRSALLKNQYQEILEKIIALIAAKIKSSNKRKQLETMIRIKFAHETSDRLMIPSRLEKRLLRIFLNGSQIEDPWLYEKGLRNQRAGIALDSDSFQQALQHIETPATLSTAKTLPEIKKIIERLEFVRLLNMTAKKNLWESDAARKYRPCDYPHDFRTKTAGQWRRPAA